jgi:ribonuclease P protein component
MKAKKNSFYLTDTQKIIKKARRILKHPGLDFLLAPTDSSPHIIIVTPAKIGTAVERNTVRRRIKALLHENHISDQNWHCVIFVKKEGIGLDYQALTKLIVEAFNAHISKSVQ